MLNTLFDLLFNEAVPLHRTSVLRAHFLADNGDCRQQSQLTGSACIADFRHAYFPASSAAIVSGTSTVPIF